MHKFFIFLLLCYSYRNSFYTTRLRPFFLDDKKKPRSKIERGLAKRTPEENTVFLTMLVVYQSSQNPVQILGT